MQKTKDNLKLFANITFFYNLERKSKIFRSNYKESKRFLAKDNLQRFTKNQKIFCKFTAIQKEPKRHFIKDNLL
jgi:hypothetical protein